MDQILQEIEKCVCEQDDILIGGNDWRENLKILAPLHKLLKKDLQWKWTPECRKAYDPCKQSLTSDTLLVHYDLNRKLRITCDASSYGLGAVLSHAMDDGQGRPIAYASRTLSHTEKNYAQIEHHKPLLAILGPRSAIPTLAAARMQRWALVLSASDHVIEYKSSEKHANCDALSRLPHQNSTIVSESAIYQVSAIDGDFPITAKDIGKATKVHSVLCKEYYYVVSVWPENCQDENLSPYHNRKLELSCEQDCVLWGSRLVIPPVFREKRINELHSEHPGVCGIKAITCTCAWWPKMDEYIERAVKGCTVCQSVRNTPPHASLIPWKWPTRPFQRVHIDFCKKMYRTTPHSTTGMSPGELMMKRRLRTRLSFVKLDLAQVVKGKQAQQKVYKDGKGKSE
ncbi:Hypothetical predicted protein [Paramuricea clavata]|uniref:Uncharacterized protein n=1 Tax=Paramuricea clavata TaxID=317549 RepID=A0A7D9IX16_PARCT|nr:Hypothetical predicted protein [Paramuricea clavata]